MNHNIFSEERTSVQRHPERGSYDRPTICAILDAALICHVGFVVEDQPYVIPMIHVRVDDALYLHGSPASRMLRTLSGGVDVCITATLLDGIVLARSVYKHSLNYRSVVLVGRARPVEDDEEKRAALVAVVEHIVPGRSADARPPNSGELRGTSVLSLPIREASAKVREGGPNDFENDVATDVWAGVIPLALVASPPEPEERVPPNVKVPMYAADYVRTAGQ